MSDGSVVERLQQEVADRQPVDWGALLAELDAGEPPSADLLQEVSLLRLLDEIGQAHGQFQSGTFGDDDEPTTVIVAAPGEQTLEEWGRYRLERKVGRGGFGSVYRAWDPHLQKPVAIKILHRRYSDERLKERLLEEGRALAKVDHRNVVRVLDVAQHDDRLGLVMEFLSGETMDAVVAARGKLDYQEASSVVEDVCRALTDVHARGFIHRDVKARNISREPDGRIVLMDFGAGLSATAEQKGVAVGTPLYMAPETLTGQPATPASDVYGAGVLLFYLVTGRYPYEGQTVDDIREAHAAGRPRSLWKLQSDLPGRFVLVVERALEVGVDDRYPTPAALLEGLLHVRASRERRRRLYAAALLVVFGLVSILVGGMLSSAAFNWYLSRSPYATESVADWFVLGRRSLVMPAAALPLLGAVIVWLGLALRNVLLPLSATFRSLDRVVRLRCASLARRVSLSDATVCSSWLVLLTAMGVAGMWIYFAPILQAISTSLSTGPAESLAVLSPPRLEYRTHYRVGLSLLAAANIVAWCVLSQATTARRGAIPGWIIGTELTVLVLLYGSMQLPYRILNDYDKFPVTTWQREHCFVLGERPQDALLFCPSMMPRIRIRSASEGPLVKTAAGESIFAAFTPQGD